MKIARAAAAGSLESNDALVSVSLGEGRLDVSVDSVVIKQFGDQIERAVLDVCAQMGVEDARLSVRDRGALECTLKARVETALTRAAGEDI